MAKLNMTPKGTARRVWNRLTKTDRRTIILTRRIWAEGSDLANHEAGLKWHQLLPSTQEKLIGVDFSCILGREVSPETE